MPGHGDQRLSGTLKFTADSSRIDLLGAFPETGADGTSDEPDVFRYDVIHALMRSGHFFTQCGVVGWRSGGFRLPTAVFSAGEPLDRHVDMKVSYAVADVFLPKTPKFLAIRFQLPGIDGILGRWRKMRLRDLHPELGYVPANFPEIEPLTIDLDGWVLTVESSITGIDESFIYTVRPDEPQDLQTYVSEVIEPMLWLARFCTDQWQNLVDIKVELPDDDEDGWPWKDLTSVRLTRTVASSDDRRHDGPLFDASSFVAEEEARKPRTLQGYHDRLDPVRSDLLTSWVHWFRSDADNRAIVRTALQPAMLPDPVYLDDRFRGYTGALELMGDARLDELGEEPDDRERRVALLDRLDSPSDELLELLGGDLVAVEWAAGVMRGSRSKGFARKVRELIDLHLEAVEPVLRDARWKGKPMKAAKVARSISERRGSLAHGAGSVGDDHDQFKWEVTRARLVLAGLILDDVMGERYRERIAAIVTARSYP